MLLTGCRSPCKSWQARVMRVRVMNCAIDTPNNCRIRASSCQAERSAIRASAAIPGLLPPFIDARGHMLVDGSVAANVPIDIMHQLKTGPNVVVTFAPPQSEGTHVDYAALPGRQNTWRSAMRAFMPI